MAKVAAAQGISARTNHPGEDETAMRNASLGDTGTVQKQTDTLSRIGNAPDQTKEQKEQQDNPVEKEKKNREEEEVAKRKREEDEKTKEQKVQDKSRPISSTPVPGTPWSVVFKLSK